MNCFKNCLILLFIFCICGCKKDKLPRVTKKGADTFGCKIDGVLFKPYYTGGLFNNVDVLGVSNSRNHGFGIHARNQETDESVDIEFSYLAQTGTYQLRQYPYRGIYTGGYQRPGWYPTDRLNTGELIVTRCDTINRIYSGRLSFTAIDPNTGKMVKVTDGRFDLKE